MSIVEIAAHVFAQATRFVIRKQMTKEEAAVISFDMAEQLFAEFEKRQEEYNKLEKAKRGTEYN